MVTRTLVPSELVMGVPHNQACMGQGRVRWHTRLRGDGEVESGNGMEGRKGGGTVNLRVMPN